MTNQECMELYENYLKNEKKASENTLCSYMRDIRQFSDYQTIHGLSPLTEATEEELSEYIESLKEAGKSVATVSRSIASLKNLYSYLTINRIVAKNPATKLVPEKSTQKLPQIMTSKEVDLLLEQPECIDAKGYRDKAMLELLYATGIRVTELIELNLSDLNLTASVVRCHNRDKERFIPLYPKAVKALTDYVELVRPQMIALPDESALFVNVNGERMSRQGFWKLIKYYQKKAKIEKDITPHTLRHSFAAHLLENGADIHVIQEILGHADISSTQVYSQLVKKQVKDAYIMAHPRA